MGIKDRNEFIGQIIDIFEDFLSDHSIRLDNKHCEVGSNDAIIYGKNYNRIKFELESLFDEWGIDDGDWFGIVRWCDDDIIEKLYELGVDATEDNVGKVRTLCENSHSFTDGMIEAGWNSIENVIYDIGLVS